MNINVLSDYGGNSQRWKTRTTGTLKS